VFGAVKRPWSCAEAVELIVLVQSLAKSWTMSWEEAVEETAREEGFWWGVLPASVRAGAVLAAKEIEV